MCGICVQSVLSEVLEYVCELSKAGPRYQIILETTLLSSSGEFYGHKVYDNESTSIRDSLFWPGGFNRFHVQMIVSGLTVTTRLAVIERSSDIASKAKR